VCESLGFESGVNKRFGEAPIFYWLFTGLIVIGGGVILIPGFPLIKMILFSQVVNGILLPFILIYMILLINKQRVMKEWVNSRLYNLIAWTSVALMVGLTIALVVISARDLLSPAGS
jgi:Mn2+/Fe2+ NRAMP family transporter